MHLKLNYREIGEGRPLLILHGLFGMLDNWASIGKALSENFRVFLIDLRDHGKSPRSEDFNYGLLADDLNNFCLDHDLSSVYVIGHSMGGKAAVQFAYSYPDLVDMMVVVDIVPRAYQGGHEEIFKAIMAIKLDDYPSRSDIQAELSKSIEDMATLQFLMKNLGRDIEEGYYWKANFKLLYKNYAKINGFDKIVHPIAIPTLLIKGGNSAYIQNQDDKFINRAFVNASIVEIQGAGHWVHASHPAELMEVVLSFFGTGNLLGKTPEMKL